MPQFSVSLPSLSYSPLSTSPSTFSPPSVLPHLFFPVPAPLCVSSPHSSRILLIPNSSHLPVRPMMGKCVHTRTHTDTHLHIHTLAHMHTHTHRHIRTHMCAHTCTCALTASTVCTPPLPLCTDCGCVCPPALPRAA